MVNNIAKQEAKSRLAEYLSSRGIDVRKKFACLNPAHQDNKPSMQFNHKSSEQKVHCFSCGASGDIFDVIGWEYGLEGAEKFRKTYEVLGIASDSGSGNYSYGERGKMNSGLTFKTYTADKGRSEKQEVTIDYSDYLARCAEDLGKTDYYRGIREDVLQEFGVGYDDNFTTNTGGRVWKALIIPTGNGVNSYSARNTDSSADKGNRYRKVGGNAFLNIGALAKEDSAIFVVEGEIDALSVLDGGYAAIGLGSAENKYKFIEAVRRQKPKAKIYLALDNDEAGQKAQGEILEALTSMGVSAEAVNISGEYKDANEALMKGRFDFICRLKEIVSREAKEAEKELQDYEQSAVRQKLRLFMTDVTPRLAYKTGFPSLDDLLGGGLYAGLYVVGAISSLGKTTFCLQIADQIAEQGQDVLVFSLEMGTDELMSKSLSRISYNYSLEAFKNKSLAKTTRYFLNGRSSISADEARALLPVVTTYYKYANRLYIIEGMGNIGVAEVRQTVEKHIRITKRKPVVLIDYVQILAPYDMEGRLSDKQNTDKNVLELKRLSRDYDIPIIGISSFNRESYSSPVTMSAFKESGSLEYGSDVVIGLQYVGMDYKEGEKKEERPKRIRELMTDNAERAKQGLPIDVECVVLKNRNSSKGTIEFSFVPMFSSYSDKLGRTEDAGIEDIPFSDSETKAWQKM